MGTMVAIDVRFYYSKHILIVFNVQTGMLCRDFEKQKRIFFGWNVDRTENQVTFFLSGEL